MRILILLLLLATVSCRSSKTAETTRTEIDSTFWYATAKRITLSDIQKTIDVQITVTELTPDSSLTMKPTKQTRYDIQGMTATVAKDSVVKEEQAVAVDIVLEEIEESTTERPKKPPSTWWVAVLVLLVIIIIRRLL